MKLWNYANQQVECSRVDAHDKGCHLEYELFETSRRFLELLELSVREINPELALEAFT